MQYISSTDNYFSVVTMFIISFFIHSIFILQGIDLFDTGVHLTHQILATTFPIEIGYTMPMIFLTDFVGGCWLRLIEEPSLLWARLGGILVISLNAAIIFSILSCYFERKRAFFVVLISILFITTIPALNIIDYFTLPALLINIELWIFNKTLIADQRSIKSNIYGFLLGFMCTPIILSKFTLSLILIIPMCLIIYNELSKHNVKWKQKILAPAFLGLIFSSIIFSIFYWHIGIFDNYVKYIYYSIIDYINGNPKSFDSSHAVGDLFSKYISDYIYLIIGTTIVFIVLYGISLIKQKFNRIISSALVLMFVIISALPIYTLIIYKNIRMEFLVVILIDIIIGLIILESIIYLSICDAKVQINLLLIAGIIVMLITPIGSGTGIIKSIQGMWLILPLSILCTDQVKRYVKNRRIQLALPSLNIILAMILIISLVFHVAWVYGDDLNRLHLNTAFSTRSLYGIYSTPEKVRVIDDLILHVGKYSDKGDYVTFSSNMPLYYYLTETKPVNNPWIEGNISNMNDMDKKYYPELIVISKVDTSKRNWPDKDTKYNTNNSLNIISKFKTDYDFRLNYSLMWENEAFSIYK